MTYNQHDPEEHVVRRLDPPHTPSPMSHISTLSPESIPSHDATKSPHKSTASHQRSKSSISSRSLRQNHAQPKAGYQQISPPSIASNLPKPKSYRIRDGELAQDFNRSKQRIRLLLAALARLLVTLIFIALFVATLHSYQGEWVFDKQGKGWFNAVVTGLSIAFGVHLAASLKSLAGDIRWYFLAQRFRPVEEANLLLDADSLGSLLKLVWKGRDRSFPNGLIPNSLQIFAVAWILVNVAFQVAVAVLGLTYSIDTSQHLSLRKAPVSVPNLAVFSWGNHTNVTLEEEQRYAAHSLGLIGSSMYFGSGQTSDYLGAVTDVGNTTARTIEKNDQGWTYRMVDSSTDGKTTIITNRTISSSFECKPYNVSSLGDEGNSDFVTVEDWPGLDLIFVGSASPGASNYLTQLDEDCGPRCTRVQVFQTKFEPDIPVAAFFDCNITITPVEGAYAPEHELSDQQAKIAAGAIGFGGSSNFTDDTAYQVYPNNAYGANSTQGNPTDMGFFLSSFAIQTVASVAAFIPRVNITTGRADSPSEGFGLSVNWHQAIPILSCIGAAHLALIAIIIAFASQVVVHDDSPLAMARLLKGKAGALGEGGSLKDGGALARKLGGMVAYGFREPVDLPGREVRSLVVGGDVEIGRPMKFPNGRYA